jgi:DNA-binding transcriptional ArsR family regulator
MADLLTSIRAEIDARLSELRPAIAEYERLSTAAVALAAEGRAAGGPGARAAPRPDAPARAPAKRAPAKTKARPRAARRARRRGDTAQSPTGQAILAALEHGSHTVAELVLVTALPASEIRAALRRLLERRAIVKTDRDGRSAYALPVPTA